MTYCMYKHWRYSLRVIQNNKKIDSPLCWFFCTHPAPVPHPHPFLSNKLLCDLLPILHRFSHVQILFEHEWFRCGPYSIKERPLYTVEYGGRLYVMNELVIFFNAKKKKNQVREVRNLGSIVIFWCRCFSPCLTASALSVWGLFLCCFFFFLIAIVWFVIKYMLDVFSD